MQNSFTGSMGFSAKLHVAVMNESSPYIQDPTACGKVSTLPLKAGFSPDIVSSNITHASRKIGHKLMIVNKTGYMRKSKSSLLQKKE